VDGTPLMTAEPHLHDKIAGKTKTSIFRRPLFLSAMFAVISTLLLADLAPRFAPGLLRFEHYLGDVRTSFLSDQLPSQHPQVAIVAITDDTLSSYKTFSAHRPFTSWPGWSTRWTRPAPRSSASISSSQRRRRTTTSFC